MLSEHTLEGWYEGYVLLADYQSYWDCQQQVSQAFQDQAHWTRMSILNSARMGKFSSDRAISEYCEDIWKVNPASVELNDGLSADRVCLAVCQRLFFRNRRTAVDLHYQLTQMCLGGRVPCLSIRILILKFRVGAD